LVVEIFGIGIFSKMRSIKKIAIPKPQFHQWKVPLEFVALARLPGWKTCPGIPIISCT